MKRKGVTLIELIIVMGIISIFSILLSSVYVSGYKTFKAELASSAIQSNAQTILDALTTDIKNGVLIEETYDIYTTGPSSIIIRIPAMDNNKNILYSGSDMLFDRIIYYYSGNAIHKVTFADPSSSRFAKNGVDSVLDSKILVLNFSYDPDQIAPTLVTTTISSEIIIEGTTGRNITISGKARLRNHI